FPRLDAVPQRLMAGKWRTREPRALGVLKRTPAGDMEVTFPDIVCGWVVAGKDVYLEAADSGPTQIGQYGRVDRVGVSRPVDDYHIRLGFFNPASADVAILKVTGGRRTDRSIVGLPRPLDVRLGSGRDRGPLELPRSD